MQKAIQVIFFFVLGLIAIVALTGFYFSDLLASQSGIFLTNNKGADWGRYGALVSGSNLGRLDIADLQYNPKDHRIMYLATMGGGLYKSVDSGANWYKLDDANKILSPSSIVYSVAVDYTLPKYEKNKNTPDRFYAAVYQNDYGRILKTDNGGLSFKQVYITSRPKFAVFSVVVDPRLPSTVWAATAEGLLLKSKDYGETWKLVQEFGGILNSVLIDPRSPNNIFVSTFGNGIFTSADSGASWTDESEALQSFPRAASIEMAYRDPSTNAIYLATQFGLLKSTNGGVNWQAVGVIFSDEVLPVTAVAVSPKNNQEIYVAAGKTIYKTANGGESWQVRQLPVKQRVRVLLVNPDNTNQVFATIGKTSRR